MEFDYEISADDYAAASVLYYKVDHKRRTASGWLLAGGVLLAVALIERDRGLSPILLGAIGVWWMWAGIGRIFPGISFRRYCRRYYRQLGLEGKRYRACLDEDGFHVVGEYRTWKHRWTDVSGKGEDSQVFMLFSEGTCFIFAKRYLVDQQQQTLRSLAGIPVR